MSLEDTLRKLPLENALGTLEIMEKLTQNVVRNPAEDKFRQIKLTNAKIAAAITNVPHAVDALKVMGWTDAPDGLSLPSSVSLTQEKEIAAIIGAKQHFKKLTESSTALPDAFEFQGYTGEKVRLLMQRNESNDIVGVEVSVKGESFWIGRPLLGESTGALACGDKALAVPERDRKRLKEYLAMCPLNLPSSSASEDVSGDAFEYKDIDGEKIRLVMQRNGSNEITDIEVLVEGKPFWTGRPTFSNDTGNLTCGDKGASAVPERDRERLKAFLAMWPQPVLKLNLE